MSARIEVQRGSSAYQVQHDRNKPYYLRMRDEIEAAQCMVEELMRQDRPSTEHRYPDQEGIV